MFWKFLRDERGATAIEYSLIAGFIALAIIYAVGMTGQRLVEIFEGLVAASNGLHRIGEGCVRRTGTHVERAALTCGIDSSLGAVPRREQTLSRTNRGRKVRVYVCSAEYRAHAGTTPAR